MTFLMCFAFVAAASRLELVNEEYRIPPREWRYVELALKQRPALVDAAYEVRSGPPGVRLLLVGADDLERLRRDEPHSPVARTHLAREGRLEYPVRRPDDYAMVVDNRSGAEAATVHLRIWLDFGNIQRVEVRTLAPQRQLAIVLVSFLVFVGIVSFSARRLLRNVRR